MKLTGGEGNFWHLLKGHLKADGGKKEANSNSYLSGLDFSVSPSFFLSEERSHIFKMFMASIMMMTALYFVPQKGEDASGKVGGWKHLWNIHQVGSVCV
jgi:hypothetical protein